MHWFWKLLISPLLDALGPRTIVEIGVEVGAVSGPLLRWAQANGALVHAIDPDPTLSVERLQSEYGERLHFHRRRSLEVLEEIGDVDVALVDGDHNWYTVINELRMLEGRALTDGREPPVVLLHDVGWPYGRRDLYYEPQAIPEAARQPHARGGLKPGRAELGPGLNDHLQNAKLEGTPANGVMTAVEDFVAQSEQPWRMWQIAGLSGMAIVVSERVLETHAALRELLDWIEGPRFLRAQCEAIERARVDAELKRSNIQRRLAETQLKQVMRASEPGAMVALRARVRELTERVAELEGDLEGEGIALAEQVRVLEGAVARLEAGVQIAAGDERAQSATLPEPDARQEQEAWATLLDLYLPLLEGALPCAEERDPLSLEYPLDLRGLLREADAEQNADEPSVDVVVCVRDALADLRRCLWSLLAKSDRAFRLILVNDGSGEETGEFLRAFADRHPAVTLIERGEGPHGYALAANAGLEAARGEYVVLLNSDTVLTPGWLGRIVDCGERHAEVGIVGPLSNAASHQSVPAVRAKDGGWAQNALPAWLTADGMAAAVSAGAAERTMGATILLPFINGFCYAIKRGVIERVGLLDGERFGEGYCEENDYSLRARAAGFALAVAGDAYVWHAKSRSYGAQGRAELANRNYEKFLEKHGRERVQGEVARIEDDRAPEELRAGVRERTADARTVASLLNGPGGEPLRVVFVLPSMAHGGSGGSHSLYQEVRALRELGVPARIALPRWDMQRAAAAYGDADEVFEAFADEEDLAARTADADVISATHHKSVALLGAIRERRSDFLAAYYVQDYEPFFTAPYIAEEAVASYTALPEMLLFAKSHWLCNVVAERHGLVVEKVQASLDRELFRTDGRGAGGSEVDEGGAGGPASTGPLRVAAMVRPRTARRQPLATIAVLEALLDRYGEKVRVSTFGCYEDELRELHPGADANLARHRGLLSRREVAELLRESDVFLDMSVYQAFGRTALEAMACGATAVVPSVGGVWEFVEHGGNALAVDTLSPDGAVRALGELVEDRALLDRLRAGARATAEGYSAVGAALSEYVLFARAHAARFGGDAHARGAGAGTVDALAASTAAAALSAAE